MKGERRRREGTRGLWPIAESGRKRLEGTPQGCRRGICSQTVGRRCDSYSVQFLRSLGGGCRGLFFGLVGHNAACGLGVERIWESAKTTAQSVSWDGSNQAAEARALARCVSHASIRGVWRCSAPSRAAAVSHTGAPCRSLCPPDMVLICIIILTYVGCCMSPHRAVLSLICMAMVHAHQKSSKFSFGCESYIYLCR